MRFWDASAILPLAVAEAESDRVAALLREDPQVIFWWTSPVECWSALARLRRSQIISLEDGHDARELLQSLFSSWSEIRPSNELRRLAGSLLQRHPLRTGDALQLAAAIRGAGTPPQFPLVTLDDRLAEAAGLEGFEVLP